LELYSNQIGDLGAQYLADALRENNVLDDLLMYNVYLIFYLYRRFNRVNKEKQNFFLFICTVGTENIGTV